MFEAESPNFASVPVAPRGFQLKNSAGTIGGPKEVGYPSQTPPPLFRPPLLIHPCADLWCLHPLPDLATPCQAGDLNGDGLLSKWELETLITPILSDLGGECPADLPSCLYRVMDPEGRGQVNFLRFLDALQGPDPTIAAHEAALSHVCQAMVLNRKSMHSLFCFLDKDGDGFLSRSDFSKGLLRLGNACCGGCVCP